MQLFIVFILELLFLFFLSREVTKLLSKLLYKITKNQTTVIFIMSFLFLPGVIVHELSHLICANLLLVSTGEVEFFPQMHGSEVKLGSVTIAKTDFVRRFFIGIAPLIFGMGFLLVLFLFFFPFSISFSWQTAIFLYVLFEIGNTMFSSRKDMEGALVFFVVAITIVSALYFLELRIWISDSPSLLSGRILDVLKTFDVLLFVGIGIDLFLYFAMWAFKKLLRLY